MTIDENARDDIFLPDEEKSPKAIEGKIPHSEMAEFIMRKKSFLTLLDTRQVLWYDEESGVYRYHGEKMIEKLSQVWLAKLGLESLATTHYMEQVIGFIQRFTFTEREQLNKDHNILVVRNGVIDLRTGELSPHSKDYRATAAVPVTYNRDAECPRITKFINEVAEPKDVQLLWEIPAWCLIPYSGIQRLVVLLGEGANGKTVYLEMLRRFLGKENCTAYSLQSLTTNRFASSGLFGKLANISPELPSKALREAGMLKTLTGQDTVEGEKKFKDSFSFVNTAKMIFATNTPPEMSEDTLAIWRRFVVIDFLNKFIGPGADKNLLAKLTTEEELSGLLNKALEALVRLEKNGDFTYHRTIEDTRAKYLLASNPAAAFIEECCDFSAWESITKEELYQAFLKFCQDNKLPGIGKKAFGHKVKWAYRLQEERDTWRGITVKQEHTDGGGQNNKN